jgi:aspartyl-tRNA(Asn)/glutamyl-tRNA(Gln) amidotransferase subunit A
MTDGPFVYQNPQSRPPDARGALAGLQICIQPNLSVRGWPTEAGSNALKGFIALEDACVVDRLRQQGVQIAGSCRMGELGFGLRGDPGAQALDAGGDAARGTDTFGESRFIASRSGCLGFKPSHGLCSRRGLIGLIPSMESLSVVAREPEGAAALLDAICGADPEDFLMPQNEPIPRFSAEPSSPQGKTVGTIRESVEKLDAPQAAAFRKTLDEIQSLGWTVREVSLPSFSLARKVHQTIGSVEASSSAGKFDGVRYGFRASGSANWNEMYLRTRAECFETLLKSYLFQGAYFQFKDYDAFVGACRIRRRLVQEIHSAFETADYLALPSRRPGRDAENAESIRELYDAFEMTLLANLTGIPAVSLPGIHRFDSQDPDFNFSARA